MVNLTAFNVFIKLWEDVDVKPEFWDVNDCTAQNGFPVTPQFKITLVHPIYILTGPYQSIGMVNLTAFGVFM
jgi:hypothetical protein